MLAGRHTRGIRDRWWGPAPFRLPERRNSTAKETFGSLTTLYCGGKHNKQELDFVRKGVMRKYVCYFYLEVVKEDSWNVTRWVLTTQRQALHEEHHRHKWNCLPSSGTSIWWHCVRLHGLVTCVVMRQKLDVHICYTDLDRLYMSSIWSCIRLC